MRVKFEPMARSYSERQEPIARALRGVLYGQERNVPCEMSQLLAMIDRPGNARTA